MKELFDCKMTILGDRAQTLGKEQQDVLKFLPKVFGKNIRTVILNKSYRNTREIADYAGKIANVKDIEFLDRHGKDVAERKFKTDEEMFEAVRANLKLEKEEFAALINRTFIENVSVQSSDNSVYVVISASRRKKLQQTMQKFEKKYGQVIWIVPYMTGGEYSLDYCGIRGLGSEISLSGDNI